LRFEVKANTGSGKERILMKKVLVIAVALTLVMSAVALAGYNPQAKVAIHVRVHNAKLACNYGTINVCSDIVTTRPESSIDAFPVFFDLTEYLGCEYALCWPDWSYSAAFTNCSDLIIGAIAWPGDGASHTWFSCKTGVMVPSFVWLYADGPGMICPCPHPISGLCSVLDCHEHVDDPMCVFCAGVFGATGDDPCAPTGTEPSTWSEIKGMFE
jgi:hypothetical protein